MRIDEVNEFLRVLVRPGTELPDLIQHDPLTSLLVPDPIESVDDDEEVSLLVAGRPDEFLGREGEVVGGGNDEDDHVDLVLSSEDGGGLDGVSVESWSVDEGDVDDTVVEEGVGGSSSVRDVDFERRLSLV